MNQDSDRFALERERLELEKRRIELESRRAEIDAQRAETDAKRAATEASRLAYEPTRLQYEAEQKMTLASYEGVLRFSDLAIKSLLLLNGGAAIGVLTFASNTARSGICPQAVSIALAPTISYFGIGAAFSAATAGLTYLAQGLFTANWDKTGKAFQIGAIFLGFASLVMFGWGMIDASSRLKG